MVGDGHAAAGLWPRELRRINQGHIHLSIDGKLVSMAYGLAQPVNGLTPGPHTLQSEFVANDHQPFGNRVIAAVLFKVG